MRWGQTFANSTEFAGVFTSGSSQIRLIWYPRGTRDVRSGVHGRPRDRPLEAPPRRPARRRTRPGTDLLRQVARQHRAPGQESARAGLGGAQRRGLEAAAGAVPEDVVDERAAYVLMAGAIQAREAELAADAPGRGRRSATFSDVAELWLEHLQRIKGAKPSTLCDYSDLLAPADAPVRLRGGAGPAARIMRAFGDRTLESITSADVARFLAGLDASGVGPRTVNKHRQVITSVFEHAMRPDTFALAVNPARAVDKRREPDERPIEFYEPEEVLALARAARE